MTETTDSEDGGYLPPLPRRVIAVGDEGFAASCRSDPGAVVDEMLERANVLLDTLAHDEADLVEDREKARFRAQREWERRNSEAEAAREALAVLTAEAERAAQRKGRLDVLRVSMVAPRSAPPRPYDDLQTMAHDEMKAVGGITGAMRIETIGALLAEATQAVEAMEAVASRLHELLLREADADLVAERKEAGASFEIGTMVLGRDLVVLGENLPTAARPWTDEDWSAWGPPDVPEQWIRLGTLRRPGLDADLPLLVDLDGPGVLLDPGTRLDEADAALRTLLLRILAAYPPGGCRFTVIDASPDQAGIKPVIDVAAREASLLVGGTRSPKESPDALAELVEHIRRVHHDYLTGRWSRLAECRAASGELLEPQRVLVLNSHPSDLAGDAPKLLAEVIDQAAACGITIVAVRRPAGQDAPPAGPPAGEGSFGFGFGFDRGWGEFGGAGGGVAGASGGWGTEDPLAALRRIHADDHGWHLSAGVAGSWQVSLDDVPIAAGGPGRRIIDEVGSEAVHSARRGLSLADALRLSDRGEPGEWIDPHDPGTFWPDPTASGVCATIGRTGVADAAEVLLDDETGHLVVIGDDDTALTTALTTIIDSTVLRHDPDEVVLDLIAAGHRRSFEPEADLALPHARFVGLEVDAAGGTSALEAVVEEISLRQARMNAAGAASFASLSEEAPKGQPLPRLLVVVDGIHDLAAGHHRLAERLGAALTSIISDGPPAGVHLVATRPSRDGDRQEDPGLEALAGCTSVLTIAEGETMLEIGGTTRRVALATTPERFGQLAALRARAGLGPDARRPQVRDGGAEAVLEQAPLTELLVHPEARGVRLKPRLWLGEPSGLGSPIEVLLRREDGANLLVVSDVDRIGHGVLLSSIVTAVLVHGTHLQITLVDLTAADDGFGAACAALAPGLPIDLHRRRTMLKALDSVRRLVSDRRETDRYGEAPALLVISGLARARDLDVRARSDPADPAGTGVELLESIVRDGPEVGVHTVIWSEHADALDRRLGSAAAREMGLRVASRLGEEDSETVIGSAAATDLGEHQAVFYDEDRGRLIRFRPYSPPDVEWLEGLSRAATSERGTTGTSMP
jgi:hypothetical protein